MRGWWREKAIPILWLAPVIVILGGALGKNIAHSTPGAEQRAADDLASILVEQEPQDPMVDICIKLDAQPSVEGVENLLDSLRSEGLSLRDAGDVVADSVLNICVIHRPLLEAFVDRRPPVVLQ